MRRSICLLLSVCVFSGCAWYHSTFDKAKSDSSKPKDAKAKVIMTPDTMISGKAVRVNDAGRFVVINFAMGTVPKIDQTLFAYRQGLKVGEVKVTGPQQADNTVADILSGNVMVGDELRSP